MTRSEKPQPVARIVISIVACTVFGAIAGIGYTEILAFLGVKLDAFAVLFAVVLSIPLAWYLGVRYPRRRLEIILATIFFMLPFTMGAIIILGFLSFVESGSSF